MGRKVLQNVFQILNPLKDAMLALDAEGVCIGVGVRAQFPPIVSLPVSDIITKIQYLEVKINLKIHFLKPPS